MSAALLAALKALAGPGVAVAVEPVAGDEGLLGAEEDAVARAIPKRRAEFAAGRRAARRALGQLGLPETAIPAAANRSPVWPEGVTGSLTHDASLAAAALAPKGTVRALGLDLTDAAPLPPRVDREILSEAERHLTGLDARLVFSAKETLFKALFPEVGRVFGFDAARIHPELAAGTFHAELTRPLGPWQAGETFDGRAAQCGAHLVTILCLPA